MSEILNNGVVEAIQSKYKIDELVDELHNQIYDSCSEPVALIGHSWGAWLIALYAEKYPGMIDNIILVGSGPLEDKYVSEIGLRRPQNLSNEDAEIFYRLIHNQATDADMERIPAVFEKSDNYCLVNRE